MKKGIDGTSLFKLSGEESGCPHIFLSGDLGVCLIPRLTVAI